MSGALIASRALIVWPAPIQSTVGHGAKLGPASSGNKRRLLFIDFINFLRLEFDTWRLQSGPKERRRRQRFALSTLSLTTQFGARRQFGPDARRRQRNATQCRPTSTLGLQIDAGPPPICTLPAEDESAAPVRPGGAQRSGGRQIDCVPSAWFCKFLVKFAAILFLFRGQNFALSEREGRERELELNGNEKGLVLVEEEEKENLDWPLCVGLFF